MFVYIPNKLGLESYGTYTALFAVVSFFKIFGFAGLSKAILIRSISQNGFITKYYKGFFSLKLTFVSISFLLYLFIALNFTKLNSSTWLISLAGFKLFYIGLKDYLYVPFIAEERMKVVSLLDILNRTLFAVLAFLFISFNLGLGGLVVATVSVDLLSLMILLNIGINREKLVSTKLSYSEGEAAILSKAFMLTLITIGITLSTKIDLYMMTYMCNAREIAIYGVGEKIILQLEGFRGILALAFLPLAVKYFAVNSEYSIVRLCLLSIVALGVFLTFAYLLSPLLIVLIDYFYDNEYAAAGEISVQLSFYLCFIFAIIPLTNAFQALSWEKYILRFIPVSIILNVVGNYFFYYKFGLIGFSYSTNLVHMSMFIYYIVVAVALNHKR